jgi:succinate-semialdehyde dehydrogenase/glutarate-semialdehyde dehydrogenase
MGAVVQAISNFVDALCVAEPADAWELAPITPRTVSWNVLQSERETMSLAVSKVIAADQNLLEASDKVIKSLSGHLRVGTRIHKALDAIGVFDPGTGQHIAEVADADASIAAEVVSIAYEAGSAWSATSARHRSDVLRRAYDLLIERSDDMALLIAREMGKPLDEARGEVVHGSDFLRWYAEEAVRTAGNFRPSPYGDARLLSSRMPVGVCLLITPWNFPLAMATRKIAPALAAGCSVILKPASLTPLTSLLFADILAEAGVPEGVVNVITTSNSGALSTAVMADRRVRKVSFTGSTDVGIKLMEQAAGNVLRTSMELGGNAPFVVLDDADLEHAVSGAVRAKLRNCGQSCIAANRFLVQEGIADAFTEAFTEAMSSIRLGHALGTGVELGALIDERAVSSMQKLVTSAVAEGAELRTGGNVVEGEGNFFEATVLDNVPPNSKIASTEIFGPIAAITRFGSEAEGVALANDTPFGLAGYVFSQDLDRTFRVAEAMEVGMVGINQAVVSNVAAPFGGVKHSGLGREGGAEGLEEYQDTKFYNIAAK